MSRLGSWIGRLAKGDDDEKIRGSRRLMCDIWRLKQLLRAEKVEPVATYNMQYTKGKLNVLDPDHHKMRLNLPPLNGLRLFEAAARCGSFKRAAQELDLTPGAISHGINSLEKWLGVELFDRSRELVLTSAGDHYLPYVKEALSMIAKGTSETLASDAHDIAGAAVGLKIGLR